jgi:predicted DCC family thiol-disulfide oxidoreductase YuxK
MNPSLAILKFDTTCLLCHRTVQFILRHDKKDVFLFDTLTSGEYEGIDSVVFIYQGQTYFYSTAVLKAIELLGGWWKLCLIFSIIPVSWRDYLYKVIAKNRSKWFGKTDTCLIPKEKDRRKFLFPVGH